MTIIQYFEHAQVQLEVMRNNLKRTHIQTAYVCSKQFIKYIINTFSFSLIMYT